MKTSLGFFATLTSLLTVTSPVMSQSITPANDGTGTVVNVNGNQFDITGGSYSGDNHNLFHSFEAFGLDAGQIANFLTDPQVQNVLSRVVGGNASVINGLIELTGSNANLFLMNPSGIIFGQGASLNVPADFTATTATGIGFNGGWFNMMGTPQYSQLVGNPTGFVFNNSESGIILNAGELGVNAGQQLNLYGGTVINTGTLNAQGGNITITAIEKGKWVRLTPEGSLLSVEVPIPQDAQGNLLNVTAASLPELLTLVPSEVGVEMNAQGEAVLSKTNTVIPTDSGTAIVSGAVDTSSVLGGEITVTGNKVGLLGAHLEASGVNGGGNILIGGDFQGNGTIPNADITVVDSQSVISADALATGNGGTVIVWSDEATQMNGNISATGGNQTGDGGFVEISSKGSLGYNGTVDVSANNGNLGEVLFDPTDIIIRHILETPSNGNFIINAGDEPATLIVSKTALEQTTGTIRLEATNNITVENGVSLDFLSGGDITFTADAGESDGVGNFSMDTTQTIETNGRNLSISGANITLGAIDTSGTSQTGSVNLTATNNITTGEILAGSQLSGSNLVNGNEITLTAGGDIVTVGLLVSGTTTLQSAGNIRLESTGGTIDTSQSLIVSGSVSGDGGNVDIIAAGDIRTAQIFTVSLGSGQGGAINLTSEQGSIDASTVLPFPNIENLEQPINLEGMASWSNLGQGGRVTLSANDSITTDLIQTGNVSTTALNEGENVLSSLAIGNDITITTEGDIITGALIAGTSNPEAAGGNINLESSNGSINTEQIITSSLSNSGGDVTLEAQDDIEVTYIDAQGGNQTIVNDETYTPPTSGEFEEITPPSPEPQITGSGQGGTVDITTEGFFRATGAFLDQSGTTASISTIGGQNGGDITIRHGGEGVTPFIVGDATVNGTLGDITSGNFAIDQGIFFNTEIQGNIAIISVENFGDIDKILQSQVTPPLPVATASPAPLPITTLSQVREILAYIAQQSTEKPALIYVRFVPPVISSQVLSAANELRQPIASSTELTDAQFAEIESEFTGEYAKFLNIDNAGSLLTQEVPDDYELEVLLITEDESPFLVQLPGVTRQEVLSQAQELYDSVQNFGDYRASARQLYEWLLQPVAEELQAREVENVLFFMSSGLRILPLAALYDGQNNEFVAQKPYSVGFAPSINLLDYRYTNLNQASVLAFGASEFAPDQNQIPLPAVETEVEEITDDQDQAFLNEDFNLTNLQQERQTNPFPIVHLATHADFLTEDPSQSYIQLYDEKLTLPQWRELNLQNPVADLLVISACKTAYGNAEIELGFGGMAVQTGVKTVIASLWSVGDVGTLALMTEFYDGLQEKPTKARALQLAQQAMITGEIRKVGETLETSEQTIPLPPGSDPQPENLSHPFYWAPFTIIGSPW